MYKYNARDPQSHAGDALIHGADSDPAIHGADSDPAIHGADSDPAIHGADSDPAVRAVRLTLYKFGGNIK